MSHIKQPDKRRLKLFVLELRAELNRVEESIAQMQHRASELLGMFQQELQGQSERMYQDLERAIVDGGDDAAAAASHPPVEDTAPPLRAAPVPHLRAVPSLLVARKTVTAPAAGNPIGAAVAGGASAATLRASGDQITASALGNSAMSTIAAK